MDLIQPIITATMIKNSGIPKTYASTALLSVSICTPLVTAAPNTADQK